MAFFPLFINLQNALCTVIGGGPVAARKILTLLEFGAVVKVVSPEVSGAIQALAAAGRIELIRREYREGDCDKAFLVIAATSSAAINAGIRQDAAASGIFVNVADAPQLCTFLFPAIVKRQDLVVGINTAGKFPALGKWIRKKITALLPPLYGPLLDKLAAWRNPIAALTDKGQKKRLIDKLLTEAGQIKTTRQLKLWQPAEPSPTGPDKATRPTGESATGPAGTQGKAESGDYPGELRK